MILRQHAFGLCVLLWVSVHLWGCGKSSPLNSRSNAIPSLTDKAVIAKVEKFCGDCHPIPQPSSFPRDQWPFEVEQGYQFYQDSDRHDLQEPLLADTLRYFQSQAPAEVVVPSAEQIKNDPSSIIFRAGPLILSGDSTSLTSHVWWDAATSSVFFSDMTTGKFLNWKPATTADIEGMGSNDTINLSPESVVAKGKFSCRAQPIDWNRDGLTDFVLGELGSASISDLKQGNISLLIQNADRTFRRIVLKEDLARSFEGVPFDYDSDGDIDILVAEFGRHKAGCFSILRNQSTSLEDPNPDQFTYEVIDPRHGLLGVKIEDMDNDGKLDLVTAFGQEFETVEILFNRGPAKYEKFEVTRFPDPSYNSSSFRVVDIDGDGRKDVVHTCGDIFDSFVPKEFHGVRILHQEQAGKWRTIELGMLVGAMDTAIADFDQDGDLDIAAVGLFPHDSASKQSYDSVVWFEQTTDFKFLRHSIERDHCYHAACEAADINGDGRTDLIVGEWKDGEVTASLRIFWNKVRS